MARTRSMRRGKHGKVRRHVHKAGTTKRKHTAYCKRKYA